MFRKQWKCICTMSLSLLFLCSLIILSACSDTSFKDSGSDNSTESTVSTESTESIVSSDDSTSEHAHTYGEWTVSLAATCTETGKQTRTCTGCGETEEVEIPALGHTVVADEVEAATCTETGLTAGSHCSVCGEILSAQEVISALGHTVVVDEAVAATCTETGLTEGSHCSVCGEILSAQEVISALGHDWVLTDTITAATCTEEGEGEYRCTRCDETKTDTIAAVGHMVVVDEWIDATCTETGLTEGSHCSVCGEILLAQEVISAFGHEWELVSIIDSATCEESGLGEFLCLLCQETKFDTIPASHKITVDEAVAATCTEYGFMEGKHCSVCGEILLVQELIVPLGHNIVVDKAVAANCIQCGLTEGKHCSVCGEILLAQEVIPALGHTVVVDEAVAANCTQCGLTEGKHCSVCGETLLAQEIIPALGHKWFQNEILIAATCEETGVAVYQCAMCGETKTDTIAAAGHTVVVDERVMASCNMNGLTEGKHCSVCGEVIIAQQTTIDENGHDFNEETHYCRNCGCSQLDYVLSDDETYYIVSGVGECGTQQTINIAAIYNGKPVKEIAEHAADSVMGIYVIPENIIKLCRNAFLDFGGVAIQFSSNSTFYITENSEEAIDGESVTITANENQKSLFTDENSRRYWYRIS